MRCLALKQVGCLQALCSVLICAAATSSPSATGNTPLNGCAQSIWQLFPPEANVTEVTKLYAKADERIRRVFPDVSTSGAYTIFLSIDAALSVAGPFVLSASTLPCNSG
jgi:hypothetical protein